MSQDSTLPAALQRENAELRARLETAEQLLRIRQTGAAPTVADLVLHTTVPMVVVDVTGRVLVAGQAARALCDRDPHDLPFMQAFSLHAVDGRPLSLPWLQAEASLAPVAVMLETGGVTRHLLFCASPLKAAHDEMFGYLVFLSDITEQKRLEEDLRCKEQEFKSLMDNSPDAITRFDREGRYRYVNPERARYFGMTPEAIIGKTWWELLTPEERNEGDIADRSFQKIVSSRAELNVEYQTHTPHGMRWVHSRGVPEVNEAGIVESVVVITRDITERKRAEEALLQTKNDLVPADVSPV
jgi:PAS domain S-box-containing protein